MSEISRFYGITIEMNPLENYLPHVIANYGEYQAMFSAESGVVMDGEFPDEESRLVQAWVLLHEREIKDNWEKFLLSKGYRLKQIAPIE